MFSYYLLSSLYSLYFLPSLWYNSDAIAMAILCILFIFGWIRPDILSVLMHWGYFLIFFHIIYSSQPQVGGWVSLCSTHSSITEENDNRRRDQLGYFQFLLDNPGLAHCFGILLMVLCKGALPSHGNVALTLGLFSHEAFFLYTQSLFYSLSPSKAFPWPQLVSLKREKIIEFFSRFDFISSAVQFLVVWAGLKAKLCYLCFIYNHLNISFFEVYNFNLTPFPCFVAVSNFLSTVYLFVCLFVFSPLIRYWKGKYIIQF